MLRFLRSKYCLLFCVGTFYMSIIFYIQSHSSVFRQSEEPAMVFHDHIKRDQDVEPPGRDAPAADIKADVIAQPPQVTKIRPLNLDNATFTHTCDNQVYTDSFFQQVAVGTYVYSAYYDNRKSPGQPAFVRLFMLTTHTKPKLWCHFKSTAGNLITVPTQDLKGNQFGYYELCENHGRPYGGFVLSCQVPPLDQLSSSTAPCSVFLSPSENPHAMATTAHLPLRSVENPKHDFGMCVPSLFGLVSPERIIEFFEVSRSLGAQHITIYHWKTSPTVRKVLQHYANTGFITVVPWNLPANAAGSSDTWNYAQILSVNDCLFRSMSSARYVTFNDIDEFIVPRFPLSTDLSKSPWAQLQSQLWKPDVTCGVCFPMVYYDLNRKPEVVENAEFNVLRYTERSEVISQIRTKCMVEPRRIFEMGIHHISKPNEEFYNNFKADPQVALVNHYRVCLADYGMTCNAFVRDPVLKHMAIELLKQWPHLKDTLQL